jgi:hypothetical protein
MIFGMSCAGFEEETERLLRQLFFSAERKDGQRCCSVLAQSGSVREDFV